MEDGGRKCLSENHGLDGEMWEDIWLVGQMISLKRPEEIGEPRYKTAPKVEEFRRDLHLALGGQKLKKKRKIIY